jgi:hypothetical protein
MYFAVRPYGSFGLPFCSMKSFSSSQCLTSVYKAWSCMLDFWSLLLFGTQRITTMTIVFGNSGRIPLAVLPARLPKSVTGHLLQGLSFFPASRTSLEHVLSNIFSHCGGIHSRLLKFSKCSQVLTVYKNSQLLSPSAVVHLASVSDDSVPG